METTYKEKANYLAQLGFEDVETVDVEGYDTEYQFTDDNMNCSIYADEFEIGNSVSQILRAATFYSCCGDELDKDYMICPSCKEHC